MVDSIRVLTTFNFIFKCICYNFFMINREELLFVVNENNKPLQA
jgi:hypothetical protein